MYRTTRKASACCFDFLDAYCFLANDLLLTLCVQREKSEANEVIFEAIKLYFLSLVNNWIHATTV